MTALVFNTRRAVFQDADVRRALILLFNFEWANKTLFCRLYKRTQSFFERSMLSSHESPPTRRSANCSRPFRRR